MLDYHSLRYWTVQTTMEKCVCIWQSKMDIERFVCWPIAFKLCLFFKFVWHCSLLWKVLIASPQGWVLVGGETLDVEKQQSQCTCKVENIVPGPHCGRRLLSPLRQRFYTTVHISRNNHRRLLNVNPDKFVIYIISNSSQCFSRSWNFVWIQGLTWAKHRWRENSQRKLCKWSIKKYLN